MPIPELTANQIRLFDEIARSKEGMRNKDIILALKESEVTVAKDLRKLEALGLISTKLVTDPSSKHAARKYFTPDRSSLAFLLNDIRGFIPSAQATWVLSALMLTSPSFTMAPAGKEAFQRLESDLEFYESVTNVMKKLKECHLEFRLSQYSEANRLVVEDYLHMLNEYALLNFGLFDNLEMTKLAASRAPYLFDSIEEAEATISEFKREAPPMFLEATDAKKKRIETLRRALYRRGPRKLFEKIQGPKMVMVMPVSGFWGSRQFFEFMAGQLGSRR